MTIGVKVGVGLAIAGLLAFIAYAWSRANETPTVTPTGATLPPVLTPATGADAPRARSSTRTAPAPSSPQSKSSGLPSGRSNT